MAYTKAQLQAMIVAEAQRQGVDPNLALQVAAHESSFNPAATSKTGAEGIFQLEPATAAEFGVTDAYDPGQNIAGGISYLKWLMDRYPGDLTSTLEAYNGGLRHVDDDTVSTAAQHYAQYILAKLGLAESPGPPAGGWSGAPPPENVPTVDDSGNLVLSAGFVPSIGAFSDLPAPVLLGVVGVVAYMVWDFFFGGPG